MYNILYSLDTYSPGDLLMLQNSVRLTESHNAVHSGEHLPIHKSRALETE